MEELIIELENLCKTQNPYSVSKKSEEIIDLLKYDNSPDQVSQYHYIWQSYFESYKQMKKDINRNGIV